MSSTDRDRRICELYEQGWSAIEIGREFNFSRSQVHRIVAAGWPDDVEAEAEAEDDDDSADRDDGPVLVAPVAFCGEEWVILPRGRGEERKRVRVERWIDARGQQCTELTFHRHRRRLIDKGIASGAEDYGRERREFDERLDAARAEYERRSRVARSGARSRA